jgi:hypothetical protein
VIAVEEEPRPLGVYRCGGKCSPEGWIDGEFYDERTACPKCRVFRVSTESRLNQSQAYVLVRARTGREAAQVVASTRPDARAFTVRRVNSEGRHSFDFVRAADGKLARKLSRGTPEECEARTRYRLRALLGVAERNWKVPKGRLAGILKAELEQYLKVNGLVFKDSL